MKSKMERLVNKKAVEDLKHLPSKKLKLLEEILEDLKGFPPSIFLKRIKGLENKWRRILSVRLGKNHWILLNPLTTPLGEVVKIIHLGSREKTFYKKERDSLPLPVNKIKGGFDGCRSIKDI